MKIRILARRARRMKSHAAASLAIALVAGLIGPALVAQPASAAGPIANPAESVNTFIGTKDEGNTFPGASAPFGMAQVSPTGKHFAGWQYDDTTVRGFGHSYLSGAGCWEQGGLLSVLPTTGEVGPGKSFDTSNGRTFDHTRYAATLTHDGEIGTAGYYRTRLTSSGGIDVEATASTRVGVQRYTFPATGNANVFLNTGQANQTLKVKNSSITVVGDRTVVSEIRVQGFCSGKDFEYTTWFATRFDRPFASSGTWNETGGMPGSTAQPSGPGQKGAWVSFDTSENRTVQLSTGLSFTGMAGAIANLVEEGLDDNGAIIPFDAVKDATVAEWNTELRKATTYGGAANDNVTFYTALYHAFLQPITSTDVDGRYRGFDDKNHVADGWTYYQWFSLWDTYRSQNQLLAMLQPERARDMARSVLMIQQQGGWLPRWAYANYEANVMTGDPASPFLADLWRFGAVQGGVTLGAEDTLSGTAVELDEKLLLAALLENIDTAPPAGSQFAGRSAIADYIAKGYVPTNRWAPKKGMDTDEHHGGSATMEYAVGDCAVSLVAKGLGDNATAVRLASRASNWKNVWNRAATETGYTGFPRERNADGSWGGNTGGFQEGTAWQYQWLAWQDADGLAEAIGGVGQALSRLDKFFDIGRVFADPAGAARGSWVTGALDYNRIEYNPNNEPNLHAAWMYNFYGEPAKTSAVNRAAQTLFTNKPNGVTGNDDLGTMSAWYVFSALGMYPSVPGSGDLLLHAPRFPRLDLDFGDTTLTIKADGADGSKLQYIDGVSFNGTPQSASYSNWDRLKKGGTLEVTLTADASTTWGEASADRPKAPCSSVVDEVAPTVRLNTAPVTPASGWHTVGVTVSATADDNDSRTPSIETRLAGGEWQPYTTEILFAADGVHILEARAIDKAGNISEIARARVAIDMTAPVTTVQLPVADAKVTTVKLVFDAEDALSGVAFTEYRIGEEEWSAAPADGVRFDKAGSHSVSYRSTDRAGNVEVARTLTVTVRDGGNDPVVATTLTREGGLATTGFSMAGLGLLATLLVFTGAVIAIAIRRRRA